MIIPMLTLLSEIFCMTFALVDVFFSCYKNIYCSIALRYIVDKAWLVINSVNQRSNFD